MHDPDTSIGGAQTRFPDTRISLLAEAASDRSPAREAILAAYWKPVYKYIRVHWRRSNEDAKDLTQGFFARALEKDFFGGFDPVKGRFRTYLRTSLDNFVRNAHAAEQRRTPALPVDFEAAERELSAVPATGIEDYFQAEWVRHLFSEAVALLQQEYESSGRERQYALFARYDLDEAAAQLTYEQLAAEFAIPATRVTNWLAAARRDFRRIVIHRLRSITANEREFRAEMRAVLGIE